MLKCPQGPARPSISYKIIPNEYTSPFCVPLEGGDGFLNSSGETYKNRRISLDSQSGSSWPAI